MKKTRKVVPLAATLIIFGSLVGVMNGAIHIDNFSLTTTTVSFDISGTLAGPLPSSNRRVLSFVNSTAADPGFVTPSGFEAPISHTWTGSQTLMGSFPLFTGDPTFDTGDYFGLFFQSNITVGEAINGTVSATFATNTFNPSEVSTINVIWGSGGDSFSNGTLQDTVTVNSIPEPSSALLVGLGVLAFLAIRKRCI